MPFTGNRQFKAQPRMIVGGQGAYYTDAGDAKSSMVCQACGAVVWAMVAVRSPRRLVAPTRLITPQRSNSATRHRLNWPTASKR